MKKLIPLALIVLIGVVIIFYMRINKEEKEQTNVRYEELNGRSDLSVATFAGGCFWCMEGPFQEMEGVEEAISGYTGGEVKDPSYEEVVSGNTGHRESVQVFYDPEIVSYDELLITYWLQIDPTDEGGQFADRGESYKTAIYYHNDKQKSLAEASKKELEDSGKYEEDIKTEVLPLTVFYPAEDYHQDYYLKQAKSYERYEILSGRKKYKDEIKRKLEF
jgi:peptide methionine sulfoxide reductase msrA/msrB